MGRCRLDEAVIRQPPRGARVQKTLLLLGQRRETLTQFIAHHCMHAKPFTLLVGHDDRRGACHSVQALGDVGSLHERAAELRMQMIENRDPGQESKVRCVEIGQQKPDEVVSEISARPDGGRSELRIASAGHDRQRELQAQRPAFRPFMEASHRVGIEMRAELTAGQLERLVELETKQGRSENGALPISDEIIDAELRGRSRGNDGAKVGQRIMQQVGQGVARGRRQPVGLIDDQDRIQRRLGNLGQPHRDPFQSLQGGGIEQGVAERRSPCACAKGQREALHQPLRLVRRLCRQPCDDCAVGKLLEPPLRQQRRLPEACRGLHQDDRAIAKPFVGQQAGTRNKVARHARWGDLEDKVVDGAGGADELESHQSAALFGDRIQPRPDTGDGAMSRVSVRSSVRLGRGHPIAAVVAIVAVSICPMHQQQHEDGEKHSFAKHKHDGLQTHFGKVPQRCLHPDRRDGRYQAPARDVVA